MLISSGDAENDIIHCKLSTARKAGKEAANVHRQSCSCVITFPCSVEELMEGLNPSITRV